MLKPQKQYGVALYDFVGENPDELTFKAGDTLEILSTDESDGGEGWWVGRLASGTQGLFPSDYIQPLPKQQQ